MDVTQIGQPVIVLGMHRSGTSFLASYLEGGGVSLGDDLLGSGVGNPRGHFEAQSVLDFHLDRLAKAFPEHSERFGRYAALVKKAPKVDLKPASLKAAAKSLEGIACDGAWGWKDPRTCLFMPLWSKLLPKAALVMVYRHPLEVHDSLMRRGGEPEMLFAEERSLDAYTVYGQVALDAFDAHKGPKVCVNANAAFADLDGMGKLLMKELGLELDLASAGGKFAKGEFGSLEIPDALEAEFGEEFSAAQKVFQRFEKASSMTRPKEKPAGKAKAKAIAGLRDLVKNGPDLLPATRLRVISGLARPEGSGLFSDTLNEVIRAGAEKATSSLQSKGWAEKHGARAAKAEAYSEQLYAQVKEMEEWAKREAERAEKAETKLVDFDGWAKRETERAESAESRIAENDEWAKREMERAEKAEAEQKKLVDQSEEMEAWAKREAERAVTAETSVEEQISWAKSAEKRAEENEKWARDNEKRAEDNEKWARDNEKWAKDNEKLAEENEKRAEDNEKWARETEARVVEVEKRADENEKWARDTEKRAEENEKRAEENEKRAEENEKRAEDNERRAEENEKLAKENEELAKENEKWAKDLLVQSKEMEEWAKRERDGRVTAEEWAAREQVRADNGDQQFIKLQEHTRGVENHAQDLREHCQILRDARQSAAHELAQERQVTEGLSRQVRTAEEEMSHHLKRLSEIEAAKAVRVLRAAGLIPEV